MSRAAKVALWSGIGVAAFLVVTVAFLGGVAVSDYARDDPKNMRVAEFTGPDAIAVRDEPTFREFERAVKLRDQTTISRLVGQDRLAMHISGHKCLVNVRDLRKVDPDAPVWVILAGSPGKWLTVRGWLAEVPNQP